MANDKHKPPSLLLSCCTCSRTAHKPSPVHAHTSHEAKLGVHKGFFRRIQCFKGS